jgi:hypothetical protein
LINVSDGYHLWSERYDRELKDVFEVQDDISRAIANRLRVDLFSLIGGSKTVLAASDSFFRRIVADNSISHFFAGTDLAHLLAHYKMFISALLGGPEPYCGPGYRRRPRALMPTIERLSLRYIPETFPRGAAGSGCQG